MESAGEEAEFLSVIVWNGASLQAAPLHTSVLRENDGVFAEEELLDAADESLAIFLRKAEHRPKRTACQSEKLF